jgi:DNA-binding CsgD family transcriptional regulator/PAS domain-containing protein
VYCGISRVRGAAPHNGLANHSGTSLALHMQNNMQKFTVEDFSRVVEAIYDSALDPEKWRGVLPQIAGLLVSQGSTFAIHDLARQEGQRYYDYGIPEAAVKSYFETYAPLNPIMPATPLMTIGTPWTLHRVVPEQEYLETRFYKEWAKPNQQGDIMGILALRAGTRIATHAINRLDSQPFYSAEEYALYSLIAPHICKALTISDALDLKTISSNALETTLNSLVAGVYLINRERRVVFMNRAAELQVTDGTAISLIEQQLIPADPMAAVRLERALSGADDSTTAKAVGGQAIAIPSPGGGGLIATVLPLHRGDRQNLNHPFMATVAVFVQDPKVAPLMPGEAFAKLYKLTPSELRIALALAPGLQLQEAADILGISIATVKSHLAKIFAKTGTSRQAELMALMVRTTPLTAAD